MAGKRMLIQRSDNMFQEQRVAPQTINNWAARFDLSDLPATIEDQMRSYEFESVYDKSMSGPGSAMLLEEVDCLIHSVRKQAKEFEPPPLMMLWFSGDTQLRIHDKYRSEFAGLTLEEYAQFNHVWFDMLFGLQMYGSLILRQPRPLPSMKLVPTIPGMVAYAMKHRLPVQL